MRSPTARPYAKPRRIRCRAFGSLPHKRTPADDEEIQYTQRDDGGLGEVKHSSKTTSAKLRTQTGSIHRDKGRRSSGCGHCWCSRSTATHIHAFLVRAALATALATLTTRASAALARRVTAALARRVTATLARRVAALARRVTAALTGRATSRRSRAAIISIRFLALPLLAE